MIIVWEGLNHITYKWYDSISRVWLQGNKGLKKPSSLANWHRYILFINIFHSWIYFAHEYILLMNIFCSKIYFWCIHVVKANGWHIAFNISRALLSCFLIGECEWHLFILLSMVWYRPSLCPWSIVWRTEFLLKLQQLDLKNDALKLGNWTQTFKLQLPILIWQHHVPTWGRGQS